MIDEAVQKAGKNVPVVFDESVQLVVCNDISFCKSCICQLQLTFYALVQEGPQFSSVCLVQVHESRFPSQILTYEAKRFQKVCPQLKEYHTKFQR